MAQERARGRPNGGRRSVTRDEKSTSRQEVGSFQRSLSVIIHKHLRQKGKFMKRLSRYWLGANNQEPNANNQEPNPKFVCWTLALGLWFLVLGSWLVIGCSHHGDSTAPAAEPTPPSKGILPDRTATSGINLPLRNDQ